MDLSNYKTVSVKITHARAYLCLKRMCDVIFASVGLLLLAVPMLLIAISVKLDSPGPVIFTQKRMGKNGKPFTIYKFRTMTVDAPRDVATCKLLSSKRYITKTGSFLRRTSMDELPQLWNIILGDMSLIGYRPLCLTERALNEKRRSAGVFYLRPGITGLAQVSGRDDIDAEEKVRYDTKYVRECSLKMDMYCAFRTVSAVISGKGVN